MVEKVLSFAVLIQYRRVTSSQPASQPRCRRIYHAYYIGLLRCVGKNTVEVDDWYISAT